VRWNITDEQADKRLEVAIVKTVAGFLNTFGGTLLIGVRDNRVPVGLDNDYATVKPANADGYVNWLTTLLINAMGEAAVMRTRIRIEQARGHDVCRVDVSASSRPVWAKKSRSEVVFFARMNNSTREVPANEVNAYIADRWPDLSHVADGHE
jgi:type I restriction enzyme R subunit